MAKRKNDAIHAFRILNDLDGDLLAATSIRRLFLLPQISDIASATTISIANRMWMSYLILTLAKWAEFYDRFSHVIPDDCRADCKALRKEIARRKIQEFRNKVVGHIWDKELKRPLTSTEIEEAVSVVIKGDRDAFFLWCHNHEGSVTSLSVVRIIERTRNRICEEYNLTSDDHGLK